MPLKVVLVTSLVTYMPDNYLRLFSEVLKLNAQEIHGLFLLNNCDRSTLLSTAGLPFLGAKRIASQLAKNIIQLPLKKREKLFMGYGIPTQYFDSMNDQAAISYIKKNKIDLIINIRTRCLYKEEILRAPRLGCLNIHHGLLPEYRGTLCDLYALTENRPAGFSIHVMEKKVDNGPILARVEVSQTDKDYLAYLKKTEPLEARELQRLISIITEHDKIPEGLENKTKHKTYTKNPSRRQIQSFLQQGFKL
jgi:methionyl-tRNA formyltransferase